MEHGITTRKMDQGFSNDGFRMKHWWVEDGIRIDQGTRMKVIYMIFQGWIEDGLKMKQLGTFKDRTMHD